MNDRQRILDILIKEAQTVGIAAVRDAANSFLKMGLKSTVTPTIRRPIPRAWVDKAFVKQQGKCKICHEPMLLQEATGDHVVALSQGGKHHYSNITAAHRSCNSSKGSNDLVAQSKKTGNLMNQMFNEDSE